MKTLTYALWLCLAACATTPVNAQCTGPSLMDTLSNSALEEMATRAENTHYARGKIWEFTRGNARITLVGTVHVYDPRLTSIAEDLFPTLAQADVLLTEITSAEESELLRNLAQNRSLAFITDGPSLIDRLPEEKWAQISEALSARNIPTFMGAQMQPWYLMLNLALPPCITASIARGDRGLDDMLMSEAIALGLPNLPLESWQPAINAFRNGTEEYHLEMLDLFLSMEDLSTPATVALLDLYFADDIAMIWELQEASLDLLPIEPNRALDMLGELEDALLIQRNRDWMPVIAENTALHDHVFIAVGAAHLPGEHGLINLLANQGWTPVQLSSP